MTRLQISWLALTSLALFAAACGKTDPPATPPEATTTAPGGGDVTGGEMVLYCGRSDELVGPLIESFEKATGIKVRLKVGKTAPLAQLLTEEGDKSPADLFWAQDAGALGQIAKAGMFATIDAATLEKVPAAFRQTKGLWIATSGRARVLAWSPKRLKAQDLPRSVFELTDPKWKGRVGWAPSNGSFKAFVTAMRKTEGEAKTRKWLQDMKANGTKVYAKNRPILHAIADGHIDLGLPNHYYLHAFKADKPDYPVDQTFFDDGDIGNLINVAGVGILKTGKNVKAAALFINHLLSLESQQFVTSTNYEYPVIDGVKTNQALPGLDKLEGRAPKVDLNDIDDLEGTQNLLREVGPF